ncbi:PREDICTED: tRNA (uracil-5-)-methyltransferase homolog A [Nicrophorus vespilloides]|uniref:tRNA (uracil(54)-C(5))-methyltransferase n=1 Tax=Nicrophorus vespilloides TaxID=110193 RepID=A0ABM1MWN0_NICVS|nr:PREDICTED: tRNA (uracil-5-)-methyltransferase homolog A [Nicrophorus vespilloides]
MSEEAVVVPAEDVRKEEEDPFAYLERDEFTSEKFKIEIKNLPRYYGIQELRKLLNETLKLNSSKLKTPKRNSTFAFVCFRNDEDRCKAIEVLTAYKWKGAELSAINAKPAPDPLVKKRRDENFKNKGNNKKAKVDDDRSVEDKLKDSTTPFWNLPYEEQLAKKQEDIKGILKKIGSDLSYQNRELSDWLNKQKQLHDGLPCELLEIRHAKTIDGYRNKCEFSVGMNEETGEKTVGFRIGSYVNGITGVGPIENLKHIPDSMKLAARLFEKFVRDSDLDVFNPENQTGQFRQLMARSAKDQLMLVVGVSPKDVSVERVDQLKKDLIEFFTTGEGKEAKVTSLYYQPLLKRTSNEDRSSKPQHLHGDTHIHETLLGLKFRVSPEAFFQVNTEAAEVLYESAIELAGATEKSTVVDICCGTGTIGLCFAKTCNQVLGLEIIPEAIEDAKQNAIINNIENSEFFAGKAEELLYSVFMRSKNENIVAIVDPPRAGLHNKAINSLRKLRKMEKLVYISCNPRQAMKNFIDFGKAESKTMHGEPFVPVRAVAVDLFPHTPHCELIIFFQRFNTLEETAKAVDDAVC